MAAAPTTKTRAELDRNGLAWQTDRQNQIIELHLSSSSSLYLRISAERGWCCCGIITQLYCVSCRRSPTPSANNIPTGICLQAELGEILTLEFPFNSDSVLVSDQLASHTCIHKEHATNKRRYIVRNPKSVGRSVLTAAACPWNVAPWRGRSGAGAGLVKSDANETAVYEIKLWIQGGLPRAVRAVRRMSQVILKSKSKSKHRTRPARNMVLISDKELRYCFAVHLSLSKTEWIELWLSHFVVEQEDEDGDERQQQQQCFTIDLHQDQLHLKRRVNSVAVGAAKLSPSSRIRKIHKFAIDAIIYGD